MRNAEFMKLLTAMWIRSSSAKSVKYRIKLTIWRTLGHWIVSINVQNFPQINSERFYSFGIATNSVVCNNMIYYII